MTNEEFKSLKRGDIIRHRMDRARSYLVHDNCGDRVTVVRTVDVTNPSEWEIVYKARYDFEECG